MPRCGCQDACSCLIVAGDGISVEGIGTLERPYEITSESSDLVGRIEFTDEGNVDFTVTGVGTLNDPTTVFADAQLAVKDLTDVSDTDDPVEGDVMVWRIDHWEFEPQSGGGGGAGLPPGGVDGQVLTKQSAADGDANWEDPTGGSGGAVVKPTEYVILRAGAVQSMPHASETAITYAAAQSDDPFGMWDGASLVTVKSSGLYDITYSYGYAATAGAGNRITLIRINGSTFRQYYHSFNSGIAVMGTVTFEVKLNAGDTIQARQYQSTGSALDTTGTPIAYAPSLFVSKQDVTIEPGGGGVIVERPISAMRRHLAATSILHATVTPIAFDTEVYTDGIVWDAANAGFIAPSDGYYDVAFGITYAANATGSRIGYIQAGNVSQAAASDGGSSAAMAGSATVKALAGELIRIMTQQTSGVSLALSGNAIYTWMSVTKVPAAYAGSAVSTYGERNYASSRTSSTATSIPNAVATAVPMEVSLYEDGIPWDGNAFVIPVDGYYKIDATLSYAFHATGSRYVMLWVNGAQKLSMASATSSGTTTVNASDTVKLAAGDTVAVRAYHTAGVALGIGNNLNYNRLTIAKVPAPVINGAAVSGVWGVGTLAKTGSDPNFGDQIYIDNRGQLRAQPQALSTSVYPKVAADLAGTYPIGMTIVQMTGAQSSAGGWPDGVSGSVVTFRRSGEVDADACASQWYYATTSSTPRAWYRSCSGTGAANQWSPWVKVFSSATPSIALSKTITQALTAASTSYVVAFESNDQPAVGITYAGGVFTVPEDGIYHLDVNLLAAGVATAQMRLSITVTNPSEAAINMGNPAWNGAGNSMLGFSRSIRMKAGATLTISAWANATGQSITGSSVNYSTMSLAKIAP